MLWHYGFRLQCWTVRFGGMLDIGPLEHVGIVYLYEVCCLDGVGKP